MPRPSDDRAHMEVLLEEVLSKVTVIAEGHVLLDQKIDRLGQRFEQRIDLLEVAIQSGFRDLRHRLDTHVHAHSN